jgi:hypothetical protein
MVLGVTGIHGFIVFLILVLVEFFIGSYLVVISDMELELVLVCDDISYVFTDQNQYPFPCPCI